MNIKITHNWLLEYLDTDAIAFELQKYLSLCGPSVENVQKTDDDYVLDIEVTSNRVDMACVVGITQEAQAILPRFGKKAKLNRNPLENLRFKNLELKNKTHHLNIKIKNPDLCSRFTALVLSGIKIDKSPEIISKRLQLCGIKSINNVVDISNYLMLTLGQPTHIFDYDKIARSIMILRESKKGEKIVTLDEKEIFLPGGDIVIEDGTGKLIDLCGIMGGLNSAVTNKTKNVVLFVQTYNKQKIRKTSMITGQRSLAATYFEKGLDEERVEPTLVYGVELLQKYAGATVSSQLYDIYPKSYRPKIVEVAITDFKKLIGVEIKKEKAEDILASLGFSIDHRTTSEVVRAAVPSWRKDDIAIKEDLIEEVARIYGYHNIPVNLQPNVYLKKDRKMDKLFSLQDKIRHFLKHIGLHEVINYSMVSEKQDLKLVNPITEDLAYMRSSLLPSLVKNMIINQGKKDILRFFEIAKVYYAKKNGLPLEVYKLGLATNTNFFDLKGIIEALLKELNIETSGMKKDRIDLFSPNVSARITIDHDTIAVVGQLKTGLQLEYRSKTPVFLAEIDIWSLVKSYRLVPAYKPINSYAVIKLDLTAKIRNFEEFKKQALSSSKLLDKLEVIDTYKDNVTIRFFFTSPSRNIKEEEAKQELEKIKNAMG